MRRKIFFSSINFFTKFNEIFRILFFSIINNKLILINPNWFENKNELEEISFCNNIFITRCSAYSSYGIDELIKQIHKINALETYLKKQKHEENEEYEVYEEHEEHGKIVFFYKILSFSFVYLILYILLKIE